MYEHEQLIICRRSDNTGVLSSDFHLKHSDQVVTTTAELIDEEGPDGQANPTKCTVTGCNAEMHRSITQAR